MDGFFVAKFKVERKSKVKPKDEDDEDMPMAMDLTMEKAGATTNSEVTGFDEDEDKKYIEGELSSFPCQGKCF